MTQQTLVKRAYYRHVKDNFNDPIFHELWDSANAVKFEVRPKYNSVDNNKISIGIYERKKGEENNIRLFRTVSYSKLSDFFELVGLQNGLREKKIKGIRFTDEQYKKIYDKLLKSNELISLVFRKKSIQLKIESDSSSGSNRISTRNFPTYYKESKRNDDIELDIEEIKNLLLSYIGENVRVEDTV